MLTGFLARAGVPFSAGVREGLARHREVAVRIASAIQLEGHEQPPLEDSARSAVKGAEWRRDRVPHQYGRQLARHEASSTRLSTNHLHLNALVNQTQRIRRLGQAARRVRCCPSKQQPRVQTAECTFRLLRGVGPREQ